MYHLAELNVARMKMDYEDPRMRDFVEQLDPVNASADATPGFVWRLQGDPDPQQAEFEASGWLVNLSLWTSLEALKEFVVQPRHLAVMRRRAEWFEKWPEATMVLWWVEAGHVPSFGEALARLENLRRHGPTPAAFTFASPFAAPQAA